MPFWREIPKILGFTSEYFSKNMMKENFYSVKPKKSAL